VSPIATERSHGPLTIVKDNSAMTLDELAKRIAKTRTDYGDLLLRYHEVWYECGHTWVYTNFLGVGMMKSPNDLWAYHDIMVNYRPEVVIETGTYQGGSALWFAFLMEALAIDGKVFTIDIEDRRSCSHPKVIALASDSRSEELVESLKSEVEGKRALIVLDSDHREAHVRKELDLYAPLTKVGDWLVVEDTNIGWTDGLGGGDRGARGGLEDYLNAHPGEFEQDIISERYLLTMHPGGWLRRVAGGRS
jgi:cephalosporin hydroxylase